MEALVALLIAKGIMIKGELRAKIGLVQTVMAQESESHLAFLTRKTRAKTEKFTF